MQRPLEELLDTELAIAVIIGGIEPLPNLLPSVLGTHGRRLHLVEFFKIELPVRIKIVLGEARSVICRVLCETSTELLAAAQLRSRDGLSSGGEP